MPTGTVLQPIQHSYFAPPFHRARVHDAMRAGVFTCPPDTPLRDVARMMATYRIHCVVVSELEAEGGGRAWGVIADMDLVAAAGPNSGDTPVREVANTELLTVPADETLERASQLMTEHEVSHLVVIQPQSGHPVGVLSSLDVAGVLAWGDDR
jgi:CBS domain-containing protein